MVLAYLNKLQWSMKWTLIKFRNLSEVCQNFNKRKPPELQTFGFKSAHIDRIKDVVWISPTAGQSHMNREDYNLNVKVVKPLRII